MNFYVATASAEVALAERWIKKLEEAGHTMTHDWTKEVCSHGGNPPQMTPAEHRKFAEADLEGATSADVFWLLLPEAPTIGAWIELGAVLTMPMDHVIISGKGADRSIFFALADDVCGTHEAAFDLIVTRWGRAR